MNKRMRELQAQIKTQKDAAQKALAAKDLDAAEKALDSLDELQKEYELESRCYQSQKAGIPEVEPATGKVSGFKLIAKMLSNKRLEEEEKSALVTGDNSTSGEGYLIPEDIRTEINELRKTYISARDLVNVESTGSLSGSVNYESGTPAGLTAFDDGDAITEETAPSFVKKTFTIGFFGKLIPISRILLGAEKAGIMGYLNRWFVRNAVISENSAIFAKLKTGYNSGTPKAIAGWKALKRSITVDLDPSCLIDGVIATNQSGFAALDAEEDDEGRPVLQPNPANPTQKLFQGLPIKVYPDTQLANIDATHFPMFYGSTKAGCTFVEYQGLTFDVSEHYLFNKNQNCLRVTEGFDVMSTDVDAYVYGSFSATPAPTNSTASDSKNTGSGT